MATDELIERIKAAFARVRDKLAVARHVLDAGYPADAVSPAYYAVFHAAESALPVEGDEPRSHEGPTTVNGACDDAHVRRRLWHESRRAFRERPACEACKVSSSLPPY